jgi:phage shock protein A
MSDSKPIVQFIADVVVEPSMIPNQEDVEQMLAKLKSCKSDIADFKKFEEEWKTKGSVIKWWESADARDHMLKAIGLTRELTEIGNKLAVLNVLFAQAINEQTREIKLNTGEIKSNCVDIENNALKISYFQKDLAKVHKEIESGLELISTKHGELHNEFEERKQTTLRSIAELHIDIKHLTEFDQKAQSLTEALQKRIEGISKNIDVREQAVNSRMDDLHHDAIPKFENSISSMGKYVELVLSDFRSSLGLLEKDKSTLSAIMDSLQNESKELSNRIETMEQNSQLALRRQNMVLILSAASLGISVIVLVLHFL